MGIKDSGVKAPELPQNALEAVSFLGWAAHYLHTVYYSSDCRRGDGWGKHQAQRQAYDIIIRLIKEVKADG